MSLTPRDFVGLAGQRIHWAIETKFINPSQMREIGGSCWVWRGNVGRAVPVMRIRKGFHSPDYQTDAFLKTMFL